MYLFEYFYFQRGSVGFDKWKKKDEEDAYSVLKQNLE